jgi:hypothetical protein
MERRVVFIAAVVFVAFGSRFANGYPFTWKLSGHVVDVYSCCDSSPTPVSDPALADLGVVAGAPFSATITLDSLTPDTDPSPSFGQYLGAVLEMAFTAGSFHASAGPAPSSGDLVINVGLQALIADAAQSDGADTLFDNPLLALQVVGAPGTFTQAIPVHPPPVSSLQPFNLHDPLLGIAEQLRSARERRRAAAADPVPDRNLGGPGAGGRCGHRRPGPGRARGAESVYGCGSLIPCFSNSFAIAPPYSAIRSPRAFCVASIVAMRPAFRSWKRGIT